MNRKAKQQRKRKDKNSNSLKVVGQGKDTEMMKKTDRKWTVNLTNTKSFVITYSYWLDQKLRVL